MSARLGVAVLLGAIVAGPVLASPAYAAAPTVTINQAPTQTDPTSTAPISFAVTFSEPVTGFDASDVTTSGTVGGALTVNVIGSGASYTVTVSGMTTPGTLSASIGAGAAVNAGGEASSASTSIDNTVNWAPDVSSPTVTIDQGPTQADPTSTAPVSFAVAFSEPVMGFNAADVTVSGTVGGALTVNVSGSGASYTVEVSGMTTSGTLSAAINAGAATDAAGNPSSASTSIDNTVTWILAEPSVTINQGSSQMDPTSAAPIVFAVAFNEPVTGFDASDVTLSGTAGGTLTVNVSGSGSEYTVTVSGMTTDGTVIATIPAGAATNAAGKPNAASTSADNTVTWQQPVSSSPSPTPTPHTPPFSGEMPVTGADILWLVSTAVLLMVTGTGIVYTLRRRRPADL